MERHTRLSRAAVVLVAIALIASIAAAVWFASPDAPYVPSEDSGAALGTAAPAEDGTVASGYQPIGDGISSMDPTREKPKGDFYLTQDITITSLHSDDKWNQAFSGTFDGNGHTITINASHTTTCNDAGGMFIGLANGAVIKNLTIVVRGFSLGFSGDTINAGMIAGYAAGEKITIDNVKLVLERTSDGNDPVDDPVNYPVNDPYVYKSNEGIDTAINFGGLIGKVEDGTVTISNTTVINNETGTYGFSARNWVRAGYEGGWLGAGAYDSKSWTNVGGFVGSVQAGKEGNGNLTMNYVKYDAADGAKMSAYASSYGLTRQYNYARLSPFLGVLNVGALKVDNLIFNAGGTFTQMFYRDGSTTDEHDEGQYCGRGILIGYDVNKWLQTTDGVSSRTEVYLRNAITGDNETGLGNGDKHTSLLAGNNSWLDGFMSYPSEIEDASFTDDGKIAFALPNRSGDIDNAVSQINQNGNVTTVSDAQIAEQVTEGGGLTWIEAPVVAHGDDTSVSAGLNKVSTGAYNVQNYDAVSSADDSAYRGSKVYDGTMVKTPTLDVGGTTVNAWTADSTSTTADAGTKTFSYNESALSGYAAATYNGGTYLVKDGTIYSPDTIIVNDEAKPFDLGKDFVYEITPARVVIGVTEALSKTYDGQEVDPDALFPAPNGVDGQPLALTATVDGGKTILNADTYSVTASLAESETNYTAEPVTITFTIETIKVSGSVAFTTSEIYDGTEKVAEFTLTSPDVLIGDDKVTITYSVEDRTNVTGEAITATANLPSDNYAWADDAAPSATFMITPKAVEIESIQELTKTYDGNVVNPKRLFIAPNGVDGQPIELTVTVDGGKTILGAGTYTVTAKPTSANYAGACEVKYIIQKALPSVTVKVDTDKTYYSSQSLYYIAIEAEEPSVAGKIAWEEGQVLSAATTEYSWVFTPDDVDNYEIVTGKVTLKVENVTLNHIEVTKNPDKMSYVAYSDFDATGMIVTAYFDGADARELSIEELTLSGNKNLQYGDGKATITIEFQEKTATVTVDVTKMLIPVPKAQTGIVFDGELHTGIVEDEQWSQYYHVDAESEERYAGTYTAVVNLNDVNNTAWEGTEDSEPKEIPWTIDHVTIEVTVNAESKTVEYGTAYSWDPYDFFAVEVTNSDLFEVKLGVFNDGSITDISTANVGEYSEGIFASVTRKDGGALEEQDLASFEFSQDIKQLVMKVIVTAKTVEVALDENVDFAAYDGEKLSEEELFGMFKTEMNIEDLAFEVDGVPYDAAEIVNAGEYTVKVVSANGNYNLTGTTEGVYKIAKATLTVTASVESEGLDTSDDLYAVPLNVKGVGVNGEEVRGTGVWASGQSLSEGTNNYKFVFTPDQEFAVNYEVCEGECEIANVAQATLTGVSVEIVATTEYVAFDAFDRSSIVVEALYGEDRKQVTDYTLTFSIGAEDSLFAGTGITVTVTYTDGDVKQSTEFTIDVAKRAVAKPVVDTTVFDATGETITLPIAESEYYTIYGNTAIEPGRYVATVELNDPANTMWEDGSTDVVSIAWTISEPVTSDEVIADILAMEKVTWQNAEEFLDLEARYNALDESEQTAEATAKIAVLRAQYDALRNAAFDDIKAAHEVTAKSLGKALAAAAAGLSAAAIALAIAKRRSI